MKKKILNPQLGFFTFFIYLLKPYPLAFLYLFYQKKVSDLTYSLDWTCHINFMVNLILPLIKGLFFMKEILFMQKTFLFSPKDL
jgi:hypothetical protein